MGNDIRRTIQLAVLRMLRPLVKILLRNGIAYGTFTELAKKLYVDVAFEEFSEQGKKQTTSRVSAMTGLTRKEVKRIRDLSNDDEMAGVDQRYNRAIRVISGWVNDERFLTKNGKPAVLQLEDSENSFAALARDYSGDIPTQAMLATLIAAGSVEKTPTGVKLINHAYVPSDDPVDKLAILGTDVSELITTIDHNLRTTDKKQLHYQRKVSNNTIPADALPAFRSLSAKQAQALLEKLDHWLSQREVDLSAPHEPGNRKYVSMGIYYFEDEYRDEEDKL